MFSKKKLLITLIVVCMMGIMIVPVLATYSISYWYADTDVVCYNPYDGSYCVIDCSTDSEFISNFRAGVSNARNQWNEVLPISVMETSDKYALNKIYGGERNNLISQFPNMPTSAAGYTKEYPTNIVDTVNYYGSEKTVSKISSGGEMCIVKQTNSTETKCTNLALHEMGHLFGWWGHSSNKNDVLYRAVNFVTELTSRDKSHLKQIYDLYY